MPELVALAKYHGMQTALRKGKSLGRLKRSSKGRKKDEEENGKTEQGKSIVKENGWKRLRLKKVTGASLVDAKKRTATISETTVFEEAEADKDIPFFFRKYTEKYPFGNVHMALRVGPLLIENGVAQ